MKHPDYLLKSTNAAVKNMQGEHLGEVVDITFSDDGESLHYLILRNDSFFGTRDRFFAIPVCKELIEVNENNIITFKANKDDLLYAKAVTIEECPKPNLQFGHSIFELFNYKQPNSEIKNKLTRTIIS